MVASLPSCPHCGTRVEARSIQHDATEKASSHDSAFDDATVKVSSQNASQDPDETVRASSLISSRLYAQAIRQDAALHTSQSTASTGKSSNHVSEQQIPTPVRVHRSSTRKILLSALCGICLVSLLLVLVGSVLDAGGSTSAHQQALQNRARLDQLMQQAKERGVPLSFLQPVITQEQQISNANTPLTLVPNPLATTIYQQQAQQYAHLQTLVPGISKTATEQLQLWAQRDMQNFQTKLSQENTRSEGNIPYFTQQFSQAQLMTASARTPSDYAAISQIARSSITALTQMTSTSQQLSTFKQTLDKMQSARLDVSALETQYQHDFTLFQEATKPGDFQNLNTQISAQYQQMLVSSVQAFAYVSVAKLNQLTEQIQKLHKYGLNPAAYQQRLDSDQVASEQAKTLSDQLLFFKQVDQDITSMRSDLVQGEARYAVTQFQMEVNSWNKANPYRNSFDGRNYMLASGYTQAGIGATLSNDLASARTITDFESIIAETNNALFNLRALEADYKDTRAYNQVHATDLQMIEHYRLQQKQILMVSLVDQAMRVYQKGKLVQAYQVTTGRQELPSLPGVWAVLDRRSPVIFTSGEPKGSPYWFPDTPINYAILYHYGGYFVHDAPWRGTIGPGTQFPHLDASGNTPYNFDGSHGCVNLQESAATWVYKNTDWNTIIVIY